MSFPYHDKNWEYAAAFIDARYSGRERILANDIFWWRFGELFRYSNLHLNPKDDYDFVIMHKGELERFPDDFLDRIKSSYKPVFANEVFIIWSGSPSDESIDSHHVDALNGLLQHRGAFNPQIDLDVATTPGKTVKFEKLSKAQLAKHMDSFFRNGGYEYETLRDKVFFAEIDRWLTLFLEDLREVRILDIACGNGRVGNAITNYMALHEIDISPVAVAMANDSGKVDPNREAIVMDAEDLKYGDETFDIVTFIEAVEHVHNLDKALSEAARVLRKGGTIVLNTANAASLHQRVQKALGYPYFRTNYQHITEPSWDDICERLLKVGLKIENAKGVFLYPYWGVPGVDEHVREICDNDPEIVEALRELGERAGPEFAYCAVIKARK